MDLMISKIAGKKFKSLVDIKHAFNNFKIKENYIFKTAAVTPDYHIELCRVIFGLANAPALLARAISIAYGDLLKLGLAKYYDDLAAGHDSFEDHLNFLQLLFEVTRKYSLKFTKNKCTFAAQEIKILGRILDEKGDRPDPEHAQAVTRYQTISTLQELRSFLGFTNALRRYIYHIASIARPLTNMLKNKPVSSKKSSNYKIKLSDDEHHAFVKLKSAITSNPVLAAFRQNVPTTVETDASHEGLGACLSQIHDGSICIIEYASRSLKDPENRYHSNELEVTAVHWAITKKFRLYLVGQTFKLITDNYSTAYIVNKAKLNRKFARYVVDLAAFDFEPIYRAGKLNIIADHLSRYPQPVNDENQCCLAIINSQNDKLVHAQQADSFCQHINKKLKIGKVCYKITRADATNKKHSRIVHVQSLKPAHYRPNLDDPGEIQFEDNNQQSPPTSLTDNIQINSPTPTIDTKVNKRSALTIAQSKKYRLQFNIDSIPKNYQFKAAELRFPIKNDQVLRNEEFVHTIQTKLSSVSNNESPPIPQEYASNFHCDIDRLLVKSFGAHTYEDKMGVVLRGRHESSQLHIQALVNLKTFGDNRIDVCLSESLKGNINKYNEKVDNNRYIVSKLIDMACFIAKQQLALRGHNEKSNSLNKAVITDETTDITKKSQLTTVFRYVNDKGVQERFIGFFDVSAGRSAKSLANHFFAILPEYKCDENKLVAQTYDGAAVMSGTHNEDFDFNFNLIIFGKILPSARSLLQKKVFDISYCTQKINEFKKRLKEYRLKFDLVWNEVNDLERDKEVPSKSKRSRMVQVSVDRKSNYKRLFYEIIDTILIKIDERFSEDTI
ncbi:hypothetical protein QTP88_010972 [Uroleucon formosanum]